MCQASVLHCKQEFSPGAQQNPTCQGPNSSQGTCHVIISHRIMPKLYTSLAQSYDLPARTSGASHLHSKQREASGCWGLTCSGRVQATLALMSSGGLRVAVWRLPR